MNTMKHYALLGLSVLLVSCGGGGGPAPAPPPPNPGSSNPPALNIVKIGEGDSLSEEFLRTAANARGDVIAVWRKVGDNPPSFLYSEIWAAVYHPATGWGAAQRVQLQSPAAYNIVEVVMDNNGDAVIAWMDHLSTGGNTVVLKAAVYVAGVWQSPQVLDQDPACFPKLSADPSGATVVYMTWCVAGEVRSSGYRIGGGWSVPTAVPLALPGEVSPTFGRIGAGVDVGGAVQVVAGSLYDLRAVRGVAGVWGPVTIIRSFSSISIPEPHLAVGVNGHAVMAWLEPLPTGYQLWAAYYDSAAWSLPVKLEEASGLVMGDPPSVPPIQIAVDSTGAAVLAWNVIQSGSSVHASRYRSGVWETTILAATGSASHLAMNANGDVRVVWGSGASRYFSGAQPWSATVQLIDLQRLDAPRIRYPLIELAPDGKPMLIWADQNGVWSMVPP